MKNERRPSRLWLQRMQVMQETYPFGKLTHYRNEEGRLHRDEGPAFISPVRCTEYRDGRKHGRDVDIWGSCCFYFRGVMVPPKYILRPNELTLDEILTNPNAEVRRVGVEAYGYTRMLDEGVFDILDEDKDTGASLLRYYFKNKDEEDLVLVKVINASADHDGSRQVFFLSVPPDMTTCKQAIAWTFRKDVDEYHPQQET